MTLQTNWMTETDLITVFKKPSQQSEFIAFIDFLKQNQIPFETLQTEAEYKIVFFNKSHLISARQYLVTINTRPCQQKRQWLQDFFAYSILLIKSPMTLFFLVSSLTIFIFAELKYWNIVSLFTFQEVSGFNIDNKVSAFDAIVNILQEHQFWRLFTPSLVHFSWFDLIVNSIIFSILAPKIEQQYKVYWFVLLLVIIALVTNLARFALTTHDLFGGLSTINYALMSFMIFTNLYENKSVYRLHPFFLWLMVIIAILGTFGLFFIHWIEVFQVVSLMVGAVLVFVRQHGLVCLGGRDTPQ